MNNLPKSIVDAIELGKQKNNERLAEKRAKQAEKLKREEEAKVSYKEYCSKWAITELPNIIKDSSAKGLFWHYVTEEQAEACKEIGLRTSREWHYSARDPDGGPGNYEGWDYKVHWD